MVISSNEVFHRGFETHPPAADFQNLTNTSKSVIHLVEQLPRNWHHIFVDNLYSDVNLFQYAFETNKVVFSGTWKKNKKVPECLKLENTSSQTKLATLQGTRKIAALASNGTILTGCSFYGTKGKHVYFLTSGRYKWNFVEGGSKKQKWEG